MDCAPLALIKAAWSIDFIWRIIKLNVKDDFNESVTILDKPSKAKIERRWVSNNTEVRADRDSEDLTQFCEITIITEKSPHDRNFYKGGVWHDKRRSEGVIVNSCVWDLGGDPFFFNTVNEFYSLNNIC